MHSIAIFVEKIFLVATKGKRTSLDTWRLLSTSVTSNVALLVLTLPHSNAAKEQVFSMVTKNKTKFYPSLKTDSTLKYSDY